MYTFRVQDGVELKIVLTCKKFNKSVKLSNSNVVKVGIPKSWCNEITVHFHVIPSAGGNRK